MRVKSFFTYFKNPYIIWPVLFFIGLITLEVTRIYKKDTPIQQRVDATTQTSPSPSPSPLQTGTVTGVLTDIFDGTKKSEIDVNLRGPMTYSSKTNKEGTYIFMT